MQTLLKVDEDDRDSIMIQEAIWEIFKTERSYMNGVQSYFPHFRSISSTGSAWSLYGIGRIDVEPAFDRRLIKNNIKIQKMRTYKYR